MLIKTVGEDVVLLGGNDRGQLYSVYTFLENYLGCRFFAKDCTVTPKRNPLILSSVEGPAIEHFHFNRWYSTITDPGLSLISTFSFSRSEPLIVMGFSAA